MLFLAGRLVVQQPARRIRNAAEIYAHRFHSLLFVCVPVLTHRHAPCMENSLPYSAS